MPPSRGQLTLCTSGVSVVDGMRQRHVTGNEQGAGARDTELCAGSGPHSEPQAEPVGTNCRLRTTDGPRSCRCRSLGPRPGEVANALDEQQASVSLSQLEGASKVEQQADGEVKRVEAHLQEFGLLEPVRQYQRIYLWGGKRLEPRRGFCDEIGELQGC